MWLKTDKGNAKLNSWCEKEGTMKASRWDTFGENFNFTVSFLACLLFFFFPQICSVECLKAFVLFLIFFFFLLCGIHSLFIFYLPSEVVPIFLVLFLTPSCAQQYLPLNPFFHLLCFSYFLISPVPSLSLYFLLTLDIPGILWLS